LPLKEFNLIETREFLHKRSIKEVMDAYLTVGGIPEYLKWLNKNSSVFLSLCQHAFMSGGVFSTEYTKIFTSSMASNKYYKETIDYLSKRKYATRAEILAHFKISSGGNFSNVLEDLEECGFIGIYSPFDRSVKSRLIRYCITDNYLQFYGKFVKPIQKNINNGDYDNNPALAINTSNYFQWLGYAFERFCRRYHRVIAKILGFSAVRYHCGAYFKKDMDKEGRSFQIDLVFERADKVLSICQIKYEQKKITTKVIDQFEHVLTHLPNHKQYTIEKVLIAFNGADDALMGRGYFDRFIDQNDLFNPVNWQ